MRFESAPGPEQLNKREGQMESVEFTQEEFAKKAVEQERGVFERFRGNAKKVAGVLVLASLASFGTGLAKKAYAAERKAIRTEQVDKEKFKINEENLTESSTWSNKVMESAKQEVGNKAETVAVFVSAYKELVREFYFPTKGNIEKWDFNGVEMSEREYTKDDLKLLLNNTIEMQNSLERLNDKFGDINGYEQMQSQLDDIESKIERRLSPVYENQQKALEQAEKMLKQIGY